MKAVNIFFILLFIISAALQYNDPDPYLWVPLYLYGAFLCYRAFKGIYNRVLYIVGLVIYISYALYLFFDSTGVQTWYQQHNAENIVQTMKATKPWIEATREFFGLLLLVVALTINMVVFKKRGSHRVVATERQRAS